MLSRIIIISLITFQAMALEIVDRQNYLCLEKGMIHYREKRELIKAPTSYCYLPESRKVFSKSCHKQKCMAFERVENSLYIVEDSNFGNPKYKICKELGGQAQLGLFKTKEKEMLRFSRCLFKDGSFISMALLPRT
jgi:hypothetical protein